MFIYYHANPSGKTTGDCVIREPRVVSKKTIYRKKGRRYETMVSKNAIP